MPSVSQEVTLVPTAPKAFDLETDFGCFFWFEQLQGNAPQGGEVLIRMPLQDAAAILTKRDSQNPVQTPHP